MRWQEIESQTIVLINSNTMKLYEILFKNSIIWTKPNLLDEIGEYFENEYTQTMFQKHGFIFRTPEELLSFLRDGSMVKVSRQELLGSHTENLTLSADDFAKELEDPDYAESYLDMQRHLENSGNITLPAPIIIRFDDVYYGYAGNRRMNLAWNNGVDLVVWLVNAPI